MDSAQIMRQRLAEISAQLRIGMPILRFLEFHFKEIEPVQGEDGEFYYRPKDVLLFRTLFYLIYSKGYSIHKIKQLLHRTPLEVIAALPDDEKLFERWENGQCFQEQKYEKQYSAYSAQEEYDFPIGKRPESEIIGSVPLYDESSKRQVLEEVVAEIMFCKRKLEDAAAK